MAKTEEVIQPSLQSILQGLNRKYGANTIGLAKNMTNMEISRVPVGIATFDAALGGGFPLGRMVELYGQPSSGKSLTSLLTIKSAQAMGLECIYVDAENSFDPEWATKLGVNVDKLTITQMSIAEDIVDTIAKLLEAKPGVIVIDSVAGMITRSEMEEDADQQFMAIKARLLSRGLAKLNALNSQTLIILINQIRNTLAMYGAPTTTPGGNSLKHFASIRVEVKRDSTPLTASGKKTDPDIVGQVVNFKITKNKTFTPFLYGSFRYLYDEAIVE